MEGQSRSSTPQSGGGDGHASPPMFQSRCSSPLNLLELELSVDRQDSTVLSFGGPGNSTADRDKGGSGSQAKERELKQVNNKRTSSSFLSPFLFFLFPFSTQSLPVTDSHILHSVTFLRLIVRILYQCLAELL